MMISKLDWIIVCIVLAVHVRADDLEFMNDNTKLKFQSGKLAITNIENGQVVSIEIERITEMDNCGRYVGKNSTVAHSYTGLVTFKCGWIECAGNRQVVTCLHNINKNAELELTINLIDANHNHTEPQYSTFELKRGMVHVEASIRRWAFCSPCFDSRRKEEGQIFEISLGITGAGRFEEHEDSAESPHFAAFPFGSRRSITLLSPSLKRTHGYPKVSEKGSKMFLELNAGEGDKSFEFVVNVNSTGVLLPSVSITLFALFLWSIIFKV